MAADAIRAALASGLALASAAAPAAVLDSGETGFVVEHRVVANAPPAAVWTAVIAPDRWWDPAHTYSGRAAALTLDARAGGCFCEALPDGGSVEHGRVISVRPGALLRLSSALGPLQAEGVAGSLGLALAPAEGARTTVTLTYVVGGRFRRPAGTLARAVDGVLGQQVARLAALFPD